MIRMDEVQKMKKAHREGLTINEIAVQFSRSWATVQRMIEKSPESLKTRGKRPKRQGKVITAEVLEAIDGYLDKELERGVWKKQRYTATTIFKELSAQGIYSGSRRQMQDAVKHRRIRRTQLKPQTYLPLEFPLGKTAQFDHGEVDCIINGHRRRAFLFVCSVPSAAIRYCQLFPIKSQEAWGEFHERAYRFFGGTFPIAVYDNDCVLVKEIIGLERKQTDFSLALEEHYKITSHFCNPASGNEKGAVENGVGYCRRNFLPGCPEFEKWTQVNEYLEVECRSMIDHGCHYKTGRLLKDIFSEIADNVEDLCPPYRWRRSLEVLVNSCQLVRVDGHDYSVPEQYVGQRVRVDTRAFFIEIYTGSEKIAEHERQFEEGMDSLRMDHYLDQLQRKPRALWDCKPVQQHTFEPEFLRLWENIKERYPKKDEANHHFIAVLILHRKYGLPKLVEAVQKALRLQVTEPNTIESILRGLIEEHPKSKEMTQASLPNIKINTWQCNYAQYEELVSGGSHD